MADDAHVSSEGCKGEEHTSNVGQHQGPPPTLVKEEGREECECFLYCVDYYNCEKHTVSISNLRHLENAMVF